MATHPDTQATAPRRELAAIMFSDIAGYTAIMGRDEARAMRALAEHRALLRMLLPKFEGRMLGEIGDGTLTSFHSASDAVNCARQAQAALKDSPDLQLRIGIHLGDVLFTDDNAWGDGVNIASRIHALAAAGSICVSATVYDEIRNKPGIVAKNLGQKHLKNVSRPIGVYVLSEAPDSAGATAPSILAIALTRRVALGAIGAIAIAALVYFLAMRKPSAPLATTAPAGGPHLIRSIAVLPLDNYSGDPNQQYFADGMTEELTTDLATISQLRVISRGSVMQFKGEHRPPTPEIAKLLNVDAVVEGSVLRVGDKVRITAQLIDAPADKHLWAKSYERDSKDVLALQDEVASAIAKAIEVRLTPNEQARLTSASTVSPAAYDAYLKGRYFFNRSSDESLKKAIAQYEDAIKLDANFAPAYAGMADAYSWAGWNEGVFTAAEAMTKEKAAAEKAIRLDDNSAEAHASVAAYKYTYEFDWVGAEREFRRAFELNPSYGYAHDQFGFALAQQGRLDEALAQSQRATELDPLSPEILADSAWALAWKGKYDAAKAQARKALDLDPTNYFAQFMIGWIDLDAGKFSDAIPELEKAAATTGAPPYIAAYIGYSYGASGDRVHALAQIEVLNKRSLHGYVPPLSPAIVYLGLGDRERAMTGLQQAYAAHSQLLGLVKMDRIFDPLRKDPRFIALLKKLNFEN
jgi:TolB-like protein/class 3 adenylate cyclase/Tfp pilus assembly protein PilF